MTHRAAVVVRAPDEELCESVLVRILGALAARADLPVDRLADAQIAAGMLAEHAPRHSTDGAVRMSFSSAPATLRLDLGPLARGGAARLLEDTRVPGVGPVLERIADEVRAETGEQGDILTLRIGPAAGVMASG